MFSHHRDAAHLPREQREGQKVRAFTLVPNDLQIPTGNLRDFDPRRYSRALRSCLYRYDAKDAAGWLIAFLDGEYDPSTRLFQLHYHGIAAGEMLDVLDRMQAESKYRSERGMGQHNRPAAFQQLQIKRQPMHNHPYGITYCLKPYWLARSSEVDEHGKASNRVLGRRLRTRILEPQHTEVLLSLDQWRLQDITLMVHLSVTSSGLTPRFIRQHRVNE